VNKKRILVGIDIGGTFTDVVIFDKTLKKIDVVKVPSTPSKPETAVLDALSASGIDYRSIFSLNHATTIATNALLTHKGLARGALITNKGFRDILEIGRQRRSEIYNLRYSRALPLIPRYHRYGVSGRVLFDGTTEESIDKKEIYEIQKKMLDENIEVVAVSMLNSYVNPTQEQKIRSLLTNFKENTFISSEIDPQYREYERTSTTVVNAVIAPLVSRYLSGLSSSFKEIGLDSPFYVMSSNGGLNTSNDAVRMPISVIESGPSAGVLASAYLSRKIGLIKAITFDMGGTTAKAGVVIKGNPDISYEFEAAGKTHSGRSIKGSGYPVRFPFIDLAEVSAGGGTIAWVDEGGSLRVGPESAGADPGPAAYGRGGENPTITDANILLGRLNQTGLLGGRMKIYRELSESSIKKKIADRLQIDVVKAAEGVVRLINNSMAKAISIVSVERGRDPRDFSMIAFGGGGPLHACEIAEETRIRKIIIPPHPGLFSAYGLLSVDINRMFSSPSRSNDSIDIGFSRLIENSERMLRKEGFKKFKLKKFVDARYLGQSYELTLPFDNLQHLRKKFDDNHKSIYGFISRDPLEVVNLKIVAKIKVQKIEMSEIGGRRSVEKDDVYRRAYFLGEFRDVPVLLRENLSVGRSGEGPAIIEDYDSTTVVNPGWKWRMEKLGNIVLSEI
jgi:N-methylhydantoinase A